MKEAYFPRSDWKKYSSQVPCPQCGASWWEKLPTAPLSVRLKTPFHIKDE